MSIPLIICFLLIIHYLGLSFMYSMLFSCSFSPWIFPQAWHCVHSVSVIHKQHPFMLWEHGCIIQRGNWNKDASTGKVHIDFATLLIGSCVSNFLNKSPKNQEESNVIGQLQQLSDTGHCGSKKLRWVQNVTRKTWGRKIHWGPFDTKMRPLAQKIVKNSLQKTGKIPQRSITTW